MAANKKGSYNMKTLIVEDELTSRIFLETFLSRYGECHVAVNGKEAVEASQMAADNGSPYELICMDIMMPGMSGQEAVKQIRAFEEARGVFSTRGAKIIMITAVDEIKEVSRSFHELCDAYLVKPVDLRDLIGALQSFQLVDIGKAAHGQS
jgi:two-component system chemotaxis response regulator CheY